MSIDLSDLGDLRRGSGNFFKNYIFEISAFQQKDEVCHSFLVEIFTKSLHRGGVNDFCQCSFVQVLVPCYNDLKDRALVVQRGYGLLFWMTFLEDLKAAKNK